MIGSTKRTARANSCERTNASAHAGPLLFVSSLFRPVFAHALRVGGSGCTVAVRVFGSGPCVACVVVSEIPTLAGQYGAPTPGAGDLLAACHALPPLGALTLVRAPVASLCAAAALMVASATMLIAVAVTVGDESRAAGVGAASHMPHTPLPDRRCSRFRPCAPVSDSGVRALLQLGPARRPTLGRVPSTPRAGTTKIQEHPAGCAVLGGYLRSATRVAQY